MDSKSLTKTSFCGKEIDNVTNNELKKHILDDMCQKTNITYKSSDNKSELLATVDALNPWKVT